MKKKICTLITCGTLAFTLFCGFKIDPSSSVKTLTNPYVTTYECTKAMLGEENLLEKYDYIKIVFIDNDELEVSYKAKRGKRKAYRCAYTYDDETGEFEAEIGILGYKIRQKTKIENGKFNIAMSILGKPLIICFSS